MLRLFLFYLIIFSWLDVNLTIAQHLYNENHQPIFDFSSKEALKSKIFNLRTNHISSSKIDSIYAFAIQGLSSKHIFEYDSHNNLLSWVSKSFNGSEWSSDFYTQYFYNQNGKRTLELHLIKTDAEWDSSLKQIYSYYANGDLKEINNMYFNKDTWINSSKSSYEYLNDGLLEINLSSDWMTDKYVPQSRFTTYKSNTIDIDSIYFDRWNGNEWAYQTKSLFKNHEDVEIIDTILAKIYVDSNWINYLEREIVNDDLNRDIEVMDKIFMYNEWQNDTRIFYNYLDDSSIIDNAFCQNWGKTWDDGYGAIIVDLTDQIRIGFITNRIQVFQSNIVSVRNPDYNQTQDFHLYQNFPNPFNPATIISYQIPNDQYITLRVFNSIGEEVTTLYKGYQHAGMHEIIFTSEGLGSGIYFYQLLTEDYTFTKMMIILK